MRYLTLLAVTLLAFALPASAEEITFVAMRAVTVQKAIEVEENGKKFVKTITEAVPVQETRKVAPEQCAIVICDMWDNHWCESAAKRCDVLAKQTGPIIDAARKLGFTIVHCPSDTMEFYKDHAARKRTLELKKHTPPKSKDLPNIPLPIDDSDGGCDDAKPTKQYRAWKRQHEAITIDEKQDFITDQGADLWNVMQEKKLTTVFVLGVHTNMCILNRTFSIKQLRKWDVNCFLVRDLTDAMYNPKMKPMVSHEAGTNLVIAYIEQHWCPSVTSKMFGK